MQLRSPLFVLSSVIRRSGFRPGSIHPDSAANRYQSLLLCRNMSSSSLAEMAEDRGLEEIFMVYHRQDNLPDVILAKGSVVTFRSEKGAIVNAANEGCLGGGGVDGAISAAGGPELYYARLRLPTIQQRDIDDEKGKSPSPTESNQSMGDKDENVAASSTNENDLAVQPAPDDDYEEEEEEEDDDDDDDDSEEKDKRIRCRTGEAVITGPGRFGKLQVPFVIHAVGPNFWGFPDRVLAYEKLTTAYQTSLDLAEKYQIEEIAFCLLSAGVYRGNEKIINVIGTGLEALAAWRPEGHVEIMDEMNIQQKASIKKIYVCAFTERECKMLVACAQKVFAEDPTVTSSSGVEKFMI